MTRLRARYGAKDNGHALLWQSDTTIKLPSALLGLTDRPQGYEQPKEVWWPSLGCAPLGEYWAVWWTVPDRSAQRGGMVRSEVALWPLAEMGALTDLTAVLEELSGAPIPAAIPARLAYVADALLNPGNSTPVLLGLEDWPGILVGLWRRLSAPVRREMAARVALTPPQSGESVAEPRLYVAPSGRRLQWPGRLRLEDAAASSSIIPSRGARWLAGQSDAPLEEILAAYGSEWPNFAALNRAARVADGLEKIRDHSSAPDVTQAIALLRTLTTLPDSTTTRALQQEAIRQMVAHLSQADYPTVKSLANIALAPENTQELSKAVLKWVENQALSLPLPDAGDLLHRAMRTELEGWWRHGVTEALRLAFAQPFGDWPRQTLRWLGLANAHLALNQLLPATLETEAGLLPAAAEIVLSDEALCAVQGQCGQRNWSRLHAHVIHKALPPVEQLPRQLAFSGEVQPGLAYLVMQLPGEVVLAQTLSKPEPPLLPLMAERTRQQPALLAGLNPGEAPWRVLWAAHVHAGGTPWPPGVNQSQLARQLLDAVLSGAKADDLLVSLAGDLADPVLAHPQRAQLWARLGYSAQTTLLTTCAQRFLQLLQTPTEPEPPLSQAILAQVQTSPRSALSIATVAGWSVCGDEDQVCRWLEHSASTDWTPATAQRLGQVAAQRRWSQLAKAMYSQCCWKNRVLAHGVQACVELLPWWDQCAFACFYAPSPSKALDHNMLARRVAEVGADLAPHEALDYWERAGGKRKDLSDKTRPSEQWHEVARRANDGAIKGGMGALISELLETYPQNRDLRELEDLLKSSR